MSKIVFWLVVIGLIVAAVQNNWFKPVSDFFNNVKADIEYQKNYVPKSHNEIDDNGILTKEEGESKVIRRSALGTVYGGR